MHLSILIVNWNISERLAECLRSLEKCQSTGWHVETIVVDNASTDGSPAMVREQFPGIRLIESPINLGFARANNRAFQASQGELILLLNPDTVVHPDAIRVLLEYLQTHPQVGAVGPRLLNGDGSLQISAHPEPTLAREAWRLLHLDWLFPISQYPPAFFTVEQPQPVDVLMGACILLRREIIEQIGLFDERFFIYSEEVDLCRRLRQAGWQIHYVPQAQVTHYGAESTRQVAGPMFIELYRNKLQYFRKHGGERSARTYRWILRITAWLRILIGTLAGWLRPAYREKTDLYRRLLRELPKF